MYNDFRSLLSVFSQHLIRSVMVSKKPSLKAFRRTEALGDFRMLLRDISESPLEGNRRGDTRTPRSLVLTVQPLNQRLEPVGESFRAVTRDISETGMGFLHQFPFPTNFVRIGPTADSISQSLARVCYNVVYQGDEMMYLVGVEFESEPWNRQ
jgi:hypothetical protein